MHVTTVRKDPEGLTMTIEAEFDASHKRAWQLWAGARQLERWWGPPAYRSTTGTGEGLSQTVGQIDAILAEEPFIPRKEPRCPQLSSICPCRSTAT
jgi:hypothetical protein